MAKKALMAGIHVVCEKPLAVRVSEAEELVALAMETNRINATHFNIRYYPMVRQMKSMREKGELGTIYSVIGSYLQDWLFYATDYNWRLEPDKSGQSRAIADIGSHLMDALEYITGLQINAVMADFNTLHPIRKKPLKPVDTYSGKFLQPEDYADVQINTEDHANVLLRFDNGNTGTITVSQVSAGRKNRLALEISATLMSIVELPWGKPITVPTKTSEPFKSSTASEIAYGFIHTDATSYSRAILQPFVISASVIVGCNREWSIIFANLCTFGCLVINSDF
jgi:predicted dehydrogenase